MTAPRRPRRPELLREVVYRQIKQWIVTGEFSPGGFLGEVALGERLEVSRTPVREALSNLQRDGLVDLVPHRGAFVRWPSPKDVDERFDIRIAIETIALQQAFPKLAASALRELLTKVRDQKRRLPTVPYREIEQLSIDVHMVVLEAAGNQRIIDLTHQLREQVYIASTLYRNPDGTVNLFRVRRVAEDHEKFLVTLLAHDLKTAVRELQQHLARTKAMVIGAVREAGRPGEPTDMPAAELRSRRRNGGAR